MSALPGKPAANSGPEQEGATATLSLGARLKRNRESMGLSTQQAADRLHLSQGMLKALETEDFSALPGSIFVKGYLKSYARLLDISSDELIRTYELLTGSAQPEVVKPVEVFRERAIWTPVVAMVAGLLMVMAAIYWFWPEKPASSSPAPADGTTEVMSESMLEPTREPAPVIERPLSEVESAFSQEEGLEPRATASEIESATPTESGDTESRLDFQVDESQNIDAVSAGDATTNGEAETPESRPNAALTSADEVDDLPAVPSGMVNMVFQGDCWVEIRDAEGTLLYSNLKRNGETLAVSGQPPLEAKLGDGSVVALSYNDQPVSFQVPKHKVVRVRLGQ